MTETIALLPCPFCGHAAKLEKQQYAHPPHHWVKCEYCAATSTSYSYPKSAIAAWNTRAVSAAEDDLLGRCLEALRQNAEGWDNAIEFGLLPRQHHDAAAQLREGARAILSQAREVRS